MKSARCTGLIGSYWRMKLQIENISHSISSIDPIHVGSYASFPEKRPPLSESGRMRFLRKEGSPEQIVGIDGKRQTDSAGPSPLW